MTEGAPARRALLFAGGSAPPPLADIDVLATPPSVELIVCADAGLSHCLAAGRVPDRLVGDFDSASRQAVEAAVAAGAERQAFARDKDASDLQLALEGLCDDGIDEVVLLGVSGGRTDHLLFNWLLPLARDWPFRLHLVDASVEATLVTPDRPFERRSRRGATLSLLPLERCRGVATVGLRYPLHEAELLPGSTLGLSNRVASEAVRVTLTRGRLLALRVR